MTFGGEREPGSKGGVDFFLRDPEIPLENDVLPLRVPNDALAVTPELGVVRRQEHEPVERPLTELLDQVAVAKL